MIAQYLGHSRRSINFLELTFLSNRCPFQWFSFSTSFALFSNLCAYFSNSIDNYIHLMKEGD